MNTLELILSRRTTHSFTTDEVSKEILQKAVLAGIHAPNHRQTWPWKFYVLKHETRQKLARLNAKLKANKSPAPVSDSVLNSYIQKFMEHGALIVLGLNRTSNPVQSREDYASIACAVQNMSLYLASEGIGSKWGTGKITTQDETYQLLDIDKAAVEIVGFLWIGKEKESPERPIRPEIKSFLIEK